MPSFRLDFSSSAASHPMRYPVLHDYLARLADAPTATAPVWRGIDGRAHGQFFNCTLTSAFQEIQEIQEIPAVHAPGADGPVAYEGFARGASNQDAGLSLWRMLDRAASADQSVELDRLCRMLHAINFFRQAQAAPAADLYLSVHDRLLSAVSSNHGYAFRRILVALGLPVERIVLQLPAVEAASRWLANYVADNYRRNGFRLAFNTAGVSEAMEVIGQFQPHAVKLDARCLREGGELPGLTELLALAHGAGVKVVVKRLEGAAGIALLRRALKANAENAESAKSAAPMYAQGHLIAPPRALLRSASTKLDSAHAAAA